MGIAANDSSEIKLYTDSNRLPIKDNKLSKIDDEFAADYGVSAETV